MFHLAYMTDNGEVIPDKHRGIFHDIISPFYEKMLLQLFIVSFRFFGFSFYYCLILVSAPSSVRTSCQWSLEYVNCLTWGGVRTPKIGFPGYYSKLHLMVRFQFWRSWECTFVFHCHYLQVRVDLEWYYMLGSHLGVK